MTTDRLIDTPEPGAQPLGDCQLDQFDARLCTPKSGKAREIALRNVRWPR